MPSLPTRAVAHEPRVLVVTGGMGFIGSNLVRALLTDWEAAADAASPPPVVLNFDALTYAGYEANLADLALHPRHRFFHADIRDRAAVAALFEGRAYPDLPPPDAVLHLAAESHVDRSIASPRPFLTTNVEGTLNLLEAARAATEAGRALRFVQVSTDEVYGDLTMSEPAFTPAHPLRPSSPYSASKAAADHLVAAWVRTYGLDASVTRCSNNLGPRQFPEKLVPLMILRATRREPLPVYGQGLNVRDWIYVQDHVRGLLRVLRLGRPGAVYHFGGAAERRNIEVVRAVLAAVGAPENLIAFVPDRPGHDLRYAMDFSLSTAELGWTPTLDFERALAATVAWYRDHEAWWRPLVEGRRAPPPPIPWTDRAGGGHP